MMRRGPLADWPIEKLLADAAAERINGVIALHGPVEGLVYLIEGDVYLADIEGRGRIDERLQGAGLLTAEQIARHTEPGDDMPYLALALDTDPSIDDHAIGDWLLEMSVEVVDQFIGVDTGEYELDPYGSHPAGILASWSSSEVLERVTARRAQAARLAEEQRLEAERLEAERLEAVRVEEERLEAVRIEEERLEAERREEAELLEAEQRLESELREAEADAALSEPARDRATSSADEEGPGATEHETAAEATGGELDADASPVETHEAIALPPPPAENTKSVEPSVAASHVLIVAADAAPEGTEVVELTTLEWRVVVPAARGISLADLCRHLDMDEETVSSTVTSLCERGLLATVG